MDDALRMQEIRNDFNGRLAMIGFEGPARDALNAQGLTEARSLVQLSKKDIDKMISHVQTEVKNTVIGRNDIRPSFPFMAVKKFKAFYHYLQYREARGQDLNLMVPLFDDDVMVVWMNHMDELDRISADADPTPPTPLSSFNDWVNWEEQLFTYCAIGGARRRAFPFPTSFALMIV
jgi:hypothetical protein